MLPQLITLHKYDIVYLNKYELKIIDKEIFGDEIYRIDIEEKSINIRCRFPYWT